MEHKAPFLSGNSFRTNLAAALTFTLLLTACASQQPPAGMVSQAEMAINNAAESNAPQLAPLELRKARDHLEKARLAIQDENHDEARRFAEKAITEAELAKVRAEATIAQRTLEEQRKSLDALRKEGSTQ